MLWRARLHKSGQDIGALQCTSSESGSAPTISAGLPGLGQNDSAARTPTLQTSQAGGVEAGSVGREESRECPGVVGQSQVGEAVCSFLRAVRSGEDNG